MSERLSLNGDSGWGVERMARDEEISELVPNCLFNLNEINELFQDLVVCEYERISPEAQVAEEVRREITKNMHYGFKLARRSIIYDADIFHHRRGINETRAILLGVFLGRISQKGKGLAAEALKNLDYAMTLTMIEKEAPINEGEGYTPFLDRKMIPFFNKLRKFLTINPSEEAKGTKEVLDSYMEEKGFFWFEHFKSYFDPWGMFNKEGFFHGNYRNEAVRKGVEKIMAQESVRRPLTIVDLQTGLIVRRGPARRNFGFWEGDFLIFNPNVVEMRRIDAPLTVRRKQQLLAEGWYFTNNENAARLVFLKKREKADQLFPEPETG